MKRIYVAGPIAGVPYDARVRFALAAARLENGDRDVEVINPFDVEPVDHGDDPCPEAGYFPGDHEDGHTSSVCFMRTDLAALLTCDEIHMLPGWRNSKGATVEHAVAVACGMTVTGANS